MKHKLVCRMVVVSILVALFFSAMGVFPAQAATLTVQSGADDGTAVPANCPGVGCRLRDAIAAADPGDTITFADNYTIALVSTLIISKNLTIDGSGHSVTLSGDSNGDGTGDVRVMVFDPGVTATLNHLTITKGMASGDYGGGIFNDNGTLTVTDSTFSDNSAGFGGGIYNYYGSVVVTDSTFTGNTATSYGGGLINDHGALNVMDSAFSGNNADTGGGIENYYGTLIVTDSVFSGNSATDGGGGINNYGPLTVTGSTFSANSAINDGGGIYTATTSGTCADTSTVTIANSTFSGNSATNGGGIHNNNGVITLLFDTITANTSGGGVRSFNDAVTCTKAGSSIIAGNTGYDVSANYGIQRFASLDYNLVGVAGYDVDFNLEFNQPNDQVNVASPMLGALADNGGPTQTHALLTGSPAIDAGDNTACAVSPVNGKDQRGATRDANCDIGAFESLNAPYPISPADGTDTHTNRPTFQWVTFSGASQYQLQVALEPTFAKPALKKTLKATQTSYILTKNLLPNTLYYWRVRAKVGKTYTDWSQIWSFTTGNPPPIPALTSPGNKKTVAGPSPLFDWKDVKAVAGVTFDHYEIQIATDANFTTSLLTASSDVSQYSGFTLASGTYYWRVRSVADNGDFSAWSTVRIVKIM